MKMEVGKMSIRRAIPRSGIVIVLCLVLSASVYAQDEGPLSKLDVAIPDYEITTIDGAEHVEIPGGNIMFFVGKPMVPYYTMSLNYPEGYQVQGVVLVERTGLRTAIGLKIPDCVPEMDMPGGEESNGNRGWFPELEREFDWMVDENPDGSTTLVIAIFPFYYNSETTDVRFYKNYSFRIDYILSTVEITKLAIDKAAYDPGEKVTLDLEVVNTGEARDIIVSAVIKDESADEIIDGLPLRKLRGLQGKASFSTQWDSTGFDTGYYRIDVELKDNAGSVLDRGLKYFTLGTAWGKTTDFNVTPQHFNIGDEISISLGFENAGSTELSGTCLFRVLNATGEIIEEFAHEFADLAPGSSLDFADVWDTSESGGGSYHILGLVLYDGQTTSPITVTVSTNYSPVAEFSYSPQEVVIDQDIIFDASGSSDKDGQIASFEWDFGDGASGSGKVVTHSYSEFGEYEAGLMVTDNEGDFDTTTQFIFAAAPVIAGEHPRWDINEDGIVNYLDLAILGAHYGETTESPYPRYDINCDGRVGLADGDTLIAHYGEEVKLETAE